MTQVNGNGLLQRKRLKKKRRLQGLTAHSAPLLLPVGGAPVSRAFVYPGRGVLPGGCRFWWGAVLGTVLAPGFSEAKALRPFLKTRGSHNEAKGPCSEVSTGLTSPAPRTVPSLAGIQATSG